MALLQLAESPYSHLAESKAISNYIFIPAGMFNQTEDTYVREDFFDSLTDDEYQEVITALAPYQNQGLSVGGLAIAGVTKAITPVLQNANTAMQFNNLTDAPCPPILSAGDEIYLLTTTQSAKCFRGTLTFIGDQA